MFGALTGALLFGLAGLVLLIPIAIGSIGYVRTARVLTSDVSEAELAMLKQIRNDLEGGFSQVRRMSWQISNSTLVREFLGVKDPLMPRDRLAAVYLTRELRPHLSENAWVRDFYIYFRNSRRLVTPSAM